jgi:uncharacterized membrane protein
MTVKVRQPDGPAAKKLGSAIDRLANGLARHWLATFNLIVAVFIGLPILAPVLMAVGATGPGRLIYRIYAPTCHQLPERSFFLFGPQVAYTVAELETSGALPAGLNILQRQLLRWNGSEIMGWKIAICERDVGIYGSILVSGVVFGLARKALRWEGRRLRKMPIWLYGLLLVPMLIDGASQLMGLRESDWWLRIVTGVLFGGATVWLAYPYVHEAMEDVMETSQAVASAKGIPQTGQQAPDEV